MTTARKQRPKIPRIFISYSTANRTHADRLYNDLSAQSIEVFLDHRSIGVGVPILSEISDAIDTSDYFVLLWSSDAAASPTVNLEWTVALTRCLHEQFVFLYVIRIDDTELPTILNARRYLDGSVDWDKAVSILVAEWTGDAVRSDRPLLPTPLPQNEVRGVNVVVRNNSLEFDHLVAIPVGATGQQIHDAVMLGLGLPEHIVAIPNRVTIDFAYRLITGGREILPTPVAISDLVDGAILQLEVLRREVVLGSVSEARFLSAHRDEVEEAVEKAFRYLTPS